MNNGNGRVKYVEKLDARAKHISELFRTVDMSVIEVIYSMNFNDPQKVEQLFFGRLDEELFMREFIKYFKSLPEKEQKQLMKDMDRRVPYDYYRNMVIGWVLEAGVYKYLLSSGVLLRENDNAVLSNGKIMRKKNKQIFDRRHIPRLDFTVGPLKLELQDTLFEFKYNKGFYILVTKAWKVKKLSNVNSYLMNINLPSKVVTVTHIIDYLSLMKEVNNYYGKNKPGFMFRIPVNAYEVRKALNNNNYYCDNIHTCVTEFKNLPYLLYNLYNTFMELKLTNKIRQPVYKY